MVDDDKIVRLPVPASRPEAQDTDAWGAESHARADTERRQRLFDWADGLLKRLGLTKAVINAKSVEALRTVTLDVNDTEVILAVNDALHPASGKRAEHFRGLKEGGLKRILASRFAELKKTREAELGEKQPDWTADLLRDKKGGIRPALANLTLMFQRAPAWQGTLAYNEFSAQVVIKRAKAGSPLGKVAPGTAWVDHHEALARIWFQRKQIYPAMGDVGRAAAAAAKDSPFHPVRSLFEADIWDGKPRLQTWPQDYLGADDTPYIRAIAPRYLISGVARIFSPGCQVDHVLVLEGPQGRLKSTLLRTLARNDAWFTDRISHIGTKDASIELAGVFLIEIAELDAFLRAKVTAQNLFITRRFERYRPTWGKYPINFPRQCILAATINPPANGCYLRDPTGARRFWPITCVGRIDIDGFRKVCDQLWAEAVHLYKAGHPWHLETPELEALATAEQDARFVRDPWHQVVDEWIGDRTDIALREVLGVLDLNDKQRGTPAVLKRVVGILTSLNFRHCRPRTPGGGREYRYQRDPPPKKKMTN